MFEVEMACCTRLGIEPEIFLFGCAANEDDDERSVGH
jgi:hypothetical protein